ncbi:ubiquitin specific hydrolase [Plasmopara halstedii]|uniref:Ubiquitin specific hydrolase n=1 Tax=Plasmopara halstedii TaxID=4781 RepID=A0A0P1B311_PLAHL|nr:ubiquitin specific hydrolase [Plasmopara halstedii]CEG48316.1 ubiquitin specific hydrolase [Plasmopara halstedii]|eukprot:XP_024584685.1 ubiquitin specific hydrolase [Plasmopara halstedii]
MMSTKSIDRFGAMELTPRHDQPLLVPGSAELDAMAAPCVISLRVVSAVDLRPMHKGITSHSMVEVSLVHHASPDRFQRSAGWDDDLKTLSGLQLRNSLSSLPAGGHHHGIVKKTFKSRVIKSSLNPMWKFDVDFGDVDTDEVAGVLFTVRHVGKFGLVKTDMGEVMLSLRDIMELKMQPQQENEYYLHQTEQMIRRDALDGINNRKSGKLLVRFNGYGVPSSYNAKTNGRVSNMFNTLVTHEDEFGRSSKSLVVHDIRSEVRILQSLHQTNPSPGETWFALHADWIRAWLLFVSKYKGEEVHSPGIMDNMPLISDDLMNGTFQIKPHLVIKKDFRMINRKSWDYYHSIYGGGPAIEVQIPANCAKPAQWLASLHLNEVGRVNSNYVDFD